MSETTFTLQISFREADRSRLLQATAYDAAGEPIEGLILTLEVDDNGTFHDEEPHRTREMKTGSNGAVYFSWWPWPRFGSSRNYTSTIRIVCDHPSARVHVEDLFE